MNGSSSRALCASALFLLVGGLSALASAGPPPPGGLPRGGATPIGTTSVQKPDPSKMAVAAKGGTTPSYTLTAYVKNEKLPPIPWPANADLPPGTTEKTSVPTAALAGAAGIQGAGQTAQGTTSPTDPPAAWVGTKGSGIGVEAFSVSLGTPWPSCLALEYMAHVPGQGDTGWFQAPARIGTVGLSKFVEGVAFRLAGSCADQYALKYNCHLAGLGDQTMMSSPAFCGTRGQGRPLEAFVAYITPSPNSNAQVPATSTPGKSTVDFLVAKVDFAVGPDLWLGTRGQGIQLTSLAVKPAPSSLATPWPSCVTLKYMGHVSGIGDTGWYDAPSFIQGGLEGVAFKLDGACASSYVVEYQCHVQGIGDVALMAGPSFCGTRGQGRRLEAVKVTVRKQ
jgi:hypothetical protein